MVDVLKRKFWAAHSFIFTSSCCKVNGQNYLEVYDIHSDFVFKL
jgi:hypothetical protein